MIGENKEQIGADDHKSLTAIRDAFVVFLVVFIARLVEVGYPPTVETVYYPFLAGLLIGIISYMRSMGIKQPE